MRQRFTSMFLLLILFVSLHITSSYMATSTTPFCVNVKLTVKPDRRDEFLSIIKADQAGTLADEANSLQFLVLQDEADDHTFFFHEEYTDKASFEAHCAAPHFQVSSIPLLSLVTEECDAPCEIATHVYIRKNELTFICVRPALEGFLRSKGRGLSLHRSNRS